MKRTVIHFEVSPITFERMVAVIRDVKHMEPLLEEIQRNTKAIFEPGPLSGAVIRPNRPPPEEGAKPEPAAPELAEVTKEQ